MDGIAARAGFPPALDSEANDTHHFMLKGEQPMPRVRPYQGLSSAGLVKELFDAAFEVDAAKYEDVRFEIGGGEDDYLGRGQLSKIKNELFEAAQRVFDRDA